MNPTALWPRTRPGQSTALEVRPWGRGRLLATLLAVVAVAATILAGLIYAAYLMIAGTSGHQQDAGPAVATGENTSNRTGTARGEDHRDSIASAAMLKVDQDAANPSDDRAPDSNPSIQIPAGSTPGPAYVQTGFPHTPEGAIGQLAQIDTAALQAMDVRTAQEIYLSWALPGGGGPQRWWITRTLDGFLTDVGADSTAGVQLSVEPAAALTKGTDGPDWTTSCVLLKVSATDQQDGKVALGHCERMQWVGGRWMIAPGKAPATAPSTWPGTTDAVRAGWRPWATTGTGEDQQ